MHWSCLEPPGRPLYLLIVYSPLLCNPHGPKQSMPHPFQHNKEDKKSLMKVVLVPVPHGKFLTGFEHNFIVAKGKISALDTWIKY